MRESLREECKDLTETKGKKKNLWAIPTVWKKWTYWNERVPEHLSDINIDITIYYFQHQQIYAKCGPWLKAWSSHAYYMLPLWAFMTSPAGGEYLTRYGLHLGIFLCLWKMPKMSVWVLNGEHGWDVRTQRGWLSPPLIYNNTSSVNTASSCIPKLVNYELLLYNYLWCHRFILH